MKDNVVVIPGPEAVIWWGVHVPAIAALFGILGILVGHWMAPVIGTPLPLQRQVAVIAAGILLSVAISMTIGQRPLLGLFWSIGIGFSGITIYQTMAAQASAGLKGFGELVVERLRGKRDGGDA